jgi:hypothetical protein
VATAGRAKTPRNGGDHRWLSSAATAMLAASKNLYGVNRVRE